MRILFDQGTPVPLRDHLLVHTVETAFELGWSTFKNGDLLAAAEGSFDLLITTDQKIKISTESHREKAGHPGVNDYELASHPEKHSANFGSNRAHQPWRIS